MLPLGPVYDNYIDNYYYTFRSGCGSCIASYNQSWAASTAGLPAD